MYNLSDDLQTFYDKYVRLGAVLRSELAGFRDLNITRLKGGLDDLAAETGRSRPHPYDWKNQGGYAMHTLNQARGDEYDIDVALLFEKADLPNDPLVARQRIRDALRKRCTNFTKEPEARKNAVTVWYAEGYHVDFAIYRTYTDDIGMQRVEHASTDWKRRDPMEINDWFAKQVTARSPKSSLLVGYSPMVENGQMRRVVRFLKWFCRSRQSWSLPGGMVISTLVSEKYQSDNDHDDSSLYKTMVAIRDRLKIWTQVHNPVDSSQELTGKPEVLNQVVRFRENLDTAIGKLAVLFKQDCSREQARYAWDWVFNHEFWASKEAVAMKAATFESTTTLPYAITIRCGLASSKNGPVYREYPNNSAVLAKGIHLRFSFSTNVPFPYTVRWIVNNQGDEATEASQLNWEKIDETVCWTSTRFKGLQRMTCQIEKGGKVMARSVHGVRIKTGSSGWRPFS